MGASLCIRLAWRSEGKSVWNAGVCVVQVLAPALLDLECLLFDEMLKFLWWGVLLQRRE